MPHPNGRPTSAELIARADAHRAEAAERQAWFDAAYAAAVAFAQRTSVFEGGEVTQACRDAGVGEPRHSNHWVTLITLLERDGVTSKGEYNMATTVSVAAHGSRSVRRWTSNVYRAG